MALELKQVAKFILTKWSEICKGFILILWYVALFLTVTIAYEKKASYTVSNIYYTVFEEEQEEYQNTRTILDNPLDYLYSLNLDYPIDLKIIFLNKIVPEWTSITFFNDNEIDRITESNANKYWQLFISIDAYFEMLIQNKELELKSLKVSKSILPVYFHEKANDNLLLPTSVMTWIEYQRKLDNEKIAKENLADTFLILIILGSFGSLIFLTKDYISGKESTISSYFFRPLFGMALAVAMFIVDIVAHAVISTGGIENIRNETMYLLGLSSGLLAEKAYNVLIKKAKNGFPTNNDNHNESVS